MNLYHDHIMDHYRHPRNQGTMENPNVTLKDTNPLCGDTITVQLQVRGGRIAQARYIASGCAISQAGASMLFEQLEGMSIQEILTADKATFLEAFGTELSVSRVKCALLALAAVKKALVEKETYDA